MKTITATAGAFTDTSKLTPGRYALAFVAATTAPATLDQGTLTLALRLDQPARIQTADPVAASINIVGLPGTDLDIELIAKTPGAAGNQITFAAQPAFSPDATPFILTTESRDYNAHLAIFATYDSHHKITLSASTWEEGDGTPVATNPATFDSDGMQNGRRRWLCAIPDYTIAVELIAERYAWYLKDADNKFQFLLGTEVDDPADLPEMPPLDQIELNDGNLEDPDFTLIGPKISLLDTTTNPTVFNAITLTVGEDDVIVPIPVVPLESGADPVITPETIDIPLLTNVDPGADALTYNLATAAQRRAHLEFIVTEPSSLLLTLTGGNTTGALHLSCNPINP